MKPTITKWTAAACAVVSTTALAHESVFKPESHAPAGVMVDHTHAKGEVMTGYRYLRTSYSDVYSGSDKVAAADLAAAGYSMMATGMTMEMVMLDIMYAPSDNLTLMLMPMYMSMDMDMAMTSMSSMDSAHGMSEMGAMSSMDDMSSMDHSDMGDHDMHHHGSHGTSGWGDTNVSAMYNWTNNPAHQFITTLGVNMPTGKVDLKNADGTFVHYGMQLGSGTWDLTPSVTYTGMAGHLNWGVQGRAIIRLEDENDSGYALGDKYAATAWGAVRLLDWMSLSARLEWSDQDAISGHYNGPHNHSSPADIQANYGGEFLDAGIGVNTVVTGGQFAGVRLGVEWITRIEEDYNGYQLGLDDGVSVSLSYAF